MSKLIVNLLYLATIVLTNPFEVSPEKQLIRIASVDSFNFADGQSEWLSFEATAYTAECDGCIGITKTGYDVRDQSRDHRIIAVDPYVIPLYSIVEIEGMGLFRALDIGGAIKGNRVDILMQNLDDAIEFGRKQVKLRVVKEGKTK